MTFLNFSNFSFNETFEMTCELDITSRYVLKAHFSHIYIHICNCMLRSMLVEQRQNKYRHTSTYLTNGWLFVRTPPTDPQLKIESYCS